MVVVLKHGINWNSIEGTVAATTLNHETVMHVYARPGKCTLLYPIMHNVRTLVLPMPFIFHLKIIHAIN